MCDRGLLDSTEGEAVSAISADMHSNMHTDLHAELHNDLHNDLHTGFAAPGATASSALDEFLRDVDQLPDIRTIQTAMRAAAPPERATTLLDVGCGLGLETTRLATEHPELHVTGVDHNTDMLPAGSGGPSNLTWLAGDYHTAELGNGCYDIVRTERVLMYSDDLAHALARIRQLLCAGGTLVSYELDYGSILLPQGDHDHTVVEGITRAMHDALPQPWAGRQLPWLAHKLGFHTITSVPLTVSATAQLWTAIVANTVNQALANGTLPDGAAAWLADHEPRTSSGFHAAVTGVLTTAHVG